MSRLSCWTKHIGAHCVPVSTSLSAIYYFALCSRRTSRERALLNSRRTKTSSPNVPDVRLGELTEDDGSGLRDGGTYELLRFTDLDISARNLVGATFSECEFNGVVANEAVLRSVRLLESRLSGMYAPSLDLARATLRDVQISDSRMGAVDLYDAAIRSVAVTASKLTWANFRGAELRNMVFTDCVFDELDLAGAAADRIAFRNCTATTLRVDQSRLRHVDLRGLSFTDISGLDSLKGAVLSSPQAVDLAPAFAAHLGVTVTD